MHDALGSNSGHREFMRLLGEMVRRLQQGERVDLDLLLKENPRFGDRLRELKPALEMLAQEELAAGAPRQNAATTEGAKTNGAPSPGKRRERAPRGDAGHIQRVLGDYRLTRELGRGGMGIVYEAVQISLEKRVALKILPFAGALDARALRRFTNEARAAAQLQHAHIVPVTNIGCDRGVHYYVMQYVEGLNLSQVIRGLKHQAAADRKEGEPTTRVLDSDEPSDEPHEEGALVDDSETTEVSPGRRLVHHSREPLRETSDLLGVGTTKRSSERPEFFLACAKLGENVASALQHAHDCGVVHRDIKPSNLMLDRHGDVWVTDFGLAQVVGAPALTLTGDVIGTLRYMSPEQALAKRVVIDHRTDVYSLGATLYELTTLHRIFDGDSSDEVLRQIAFNEPVRPRRLNPRMPRDLETIILKALEKNPDERYQTAADLANDLKAFRDDLPISVRPPTIVHRSRKWLRKHRGVAWSATAVALLVFLGSLIGTAIVWKALGDTNVAKAEAEEARDEYFELLKKSEGSRLAAQSALERPRNPGLATLIAIEAAELRPGLVANRAMLSALEELHEVWTIPKSHSPAPAGASFSPDGRKVITTARIAEGAAEPAKIWDIQTRKLLRKLDDGTRISSAIFSPDGGRVLTISTAVKPPSGDDKRGAIERSAPALWDAVTGQKLQTLEGATLSEVHAAVFDSKGRRLVTPSESNTVRIYDVIGGHVLRELKGHEKPVIYAAFDPTGRRVGTISADRTARVWEAETGQEICKIDWSGDSASIGAWSGTIAFSLDGSKLLTGTSSHGAQLWNAASGKQLIDASWPGENVRFSPDGERIYAYQPSGELQARATRDGGLLYPSGVGPRRVTHFDASSDGRTLLTSSRSEVIQLWRADSGEPIAVLRGHEGVVSTAAFDASGRFVVSTSRDGTVRIWSVDTAAERFRLKTEVANRARPIVAFHPDKKRLLTVTPPTFAAHVWDVATDRRLANWSGRPSLAYLSESKQVVVDGDRIVVWSRTEESPLATLRTPRSHFRDAVLSPDERQVATIVERGPVWLWNLEDDTRIELKDGQERMRGVAYHPDGGHVAIASGDGVARVFDANSGEVVARLPHEGDVRSAIFSPDGAKLLTVSEFGRARVWEWSTQTEIAAAPTGAAFLAAVFSRDGGRLLTYDQVDGQAVACWDAATGEKQRELKIAGIVGIATSPASPEILIASSAKGAHLWNYETGESHVVSEKPVSAVAFSASGKRFAIALASPRVPPQFAPLGSPVTSLGEATIEVYAAEERTLNRTLSAGGAEVRAMKFVPGEESIVLDALSYGGAICDLETNRELVRFSGHAAPIAHAEFDPKSERFVTASWDETAIVWNAKTGKIERRLVGHDAPLVHCAFSGDGETIATASADGTCRLWEASGDAAPQVLSGHADQVWRVAFSDDGKRLLTLSRDKTVRVWDRHSLQSTVIEDRDKLIGFAQFEPQGDRLLIAPDRELSVARIDVAGDSPFYRLEPLAATDESQGFDVKILGALGATLVKLPHKAPALSAQFSPDGKQVVTVTAEGGGILWRASDGEKLFTFAVPGSPIHHAAFSQDGGQLLTVHQGEMVVWDVTSRERRHAFREPEGNSFEKTWPLDRPHNPFSPDGKWLLTVSSGRIHKWPLKPVEAAKTAAPRKLTSDEKKKFEIRSL